MEKGSFRYFPTRKKDEFEKNIVKAASGIKKSFYIEQVRGKIVKSQ